MVKSDITLLFEPLNTYVDNTGYFLFSSSEAFNIAEQVASANVKVLYDIYHQQIMEANLIATITKNIDKIGHVHVAGNPGRNELYTGEINYKEVFRAIERTTYDGYIGLEYFLSQDVATGLRKTLEAIDFGT